MAWMEGHRWAAALAVWLWLTVCAVTGAVIVHGATRLIRALRRAA